MQKLHPKTVWLFFFHLLERGVGLVVLFTILVLSIQLALTKTTSEGGLAFSVQPFLLLIFLAIILLFFIFIYFWAKLMYRFWRYEITEDTVKLEHGVIWKKYTSIPFERVQNIDIHRGLLDRILGLSSLYIQTAGYTGYARSEGALPGLLPEDAERMRESLIKKIKGTKQGI